MSLAVTFVGHATTLVETSGARVLTDPVLRDRVTFLARVGEPTAPVPDPDVILISHLHQDHCDLPTLRQFPAVPIVAPRGSGAFLAAQLGRDVTELAVGSQLEFADVRITAVPAIHDGSRPPFGPKAEAVGYLCASSDGNVYFAGDTEIFPAMSELGSDVGGVDVALLPVWGWGPNLGEGHMNPARAARAVQRIDPRVAIPIHWGTFFPVGMRRVLASANVLLNRPPEVFAELCGQYSPTTDVHVLQPGNGWRRDG